MAKKYENVSWIRKIRTKNMSNKELVRGMQRSGGAETFRGRVFASILNERGISPEKWMKKVAGVQFEGFLNEFEKIGGAAQIAKAVGLAGGGAALGAGGMYVHGERKRKTQLRQLANLFRKANIAENQQIRRQAVGKTLQAVRSRMALARNSYNAGKANTK